MRQLIFILLGCALVVGILAGGWALEDAGVHLPGIDTPRSLIPSPTAACPR